MNTFVWNAPTWFPLWIQENYSGGIDNQRDKLAFNPLASGAHRGRHLTAIHCPTGGATAGPAKVKRSVISLPPQSWMFRIRHSTEARDDDDEDGDDKYIDEDYDKYDDGILKY